MILKDLTWFLISLKHVKDVRPFINQIFQWDRLYNDPNLYDKWSNSKN